uniref:Candidate secreted effector n=1 Tax=Meloidogyne incognita TaxID=6306 RepID=A0A914MQA2_MELIC
MQLTKHQHTNNINFRLVMMNFLSSRMHLIKHQPTPINFHLHHCYINNLFKMFRF